MPLDPALDRRALLADRVVPAPMTCPRCKEKSFLYDKFLNRWQCSNVHCRFHD